MHMNEGETIVDFFTRSVLLANQMKPCSETITKLQKIEKVVIEESKNIFEMKQSYNFH